MYFNSGDTLSTHVGTSMCTRICMRSHNYVHTCTHADSRLEEARRRQRNITEAFQFVRPEKERIGKGSGKVENSKSLQAVQVGFLASKIGFCAFFLSLSLSLRKRGVQLVAFLLLFRLIWSPVLAVLLRRFAAGHVLRRRVDSCFPINRARSVYSHSFCVHLFIYSSVRFCGLLKVLRG